MANVPINSITLEDVLATDSSFELQRSVAAGEASRRTTLLSILEASQTWKGLYDVREAGIIGDGSDETAKMNQAYVEAQADSRYCYVPNGFNIGVSSTVRVRAPTLGEGMIAGSNTNSPRFTNVGINDIYTPMLQLDTTLDLNLHSYFAWRGVQVFGNNATTGRKCSGINVIGGRATPGDWNSNIRCLTNYLFDDSVVQDCYGFGMRLVGFIGMIRRMRMYSNGINRLILGNSCLIEGGEYVPMRDITGPMVGINSWGLQLIASDGKAIRTYESVHKIHLNSVTIESNGICNGLSIGENLINIKCTNLYLEGFESDDTQVTYSLDVGSVGMSEDPASSTYALLPATGLQVDAVRGITFDSGALGGASGYSKKGGNARFNNIRGLTFVGKNSMSAKHCEFTDKCFDVVGLPAGTGVQGDSYYYKDAWITDATDSIGNANRSIILNPDGAGGVRGWKDIIDKSSGRVSLSEETSIIRVAPTSLKVTHNGAAIGGSTASEAVELYPFGLDRRNMRRKILGFACWVYIPSGGDYDDGIFSPGLSIDYESDTSDGSGTWVLNANFPRSFQYTYQNEGDATYYNAAFNTPDNWHLVYIWKHLPDLPIRNIRLTLYPLVKTADVPDPTGPNSCYFADMRMAVNPASMERLAEGTWTFDPEAGVVLPGGAIQTYGPSVPASTVINSLPGDTHKNSAPTSGAITEWECVVKGKPGTWVATKRAEEATPILEYDFSKATLAEAAVNGPIPSLTRASAAWMRQADGRLVKVLTNVARCAHFPGNMRATRTTGSAGQWAVTPSSGGLLVEPSRTNMVPNTQITTPWAGTNGIAANEVSTLAGPDMGLLEAMKITTDTSTGTHYTWSSMGLVNADFADAGKYTHSLFVRSGTATAVRLSTKNKSNTLYASVVVDLTSGAILSQTSFGANIESVGTEAYINGWYRIWISVKDIGTGLTTTPDFQVYVCQFDGTSTYTGVGEYLYIWGPQVEAGADMSSYIRTEGSAVTRSADALGLITLPTEKQLSKQAATIYVDYLAAVKDVTVADSQVLKFAGTSPASFFKLAHTIDRLDFLASSSGQFAAVSATGEAKNPSQVHAAFTYKDAGAAFMMTQNGQAVIAAEDYGDLAAYFGVVPDLVRLTLGGTFNIVQYMKVIPADHSEAQIIENTL